MIAATTQATNQSQKRIDFLLKRYFPDDSEKRELLLTLAKLDPTPSKKYLDWILRHHLAGWKGNRQQQQRLTLHLEMFEELKTFTKGTQIFRKLKAKGYDADIFKFDPVSLLKLIRSIRGMLKHEKQRRKIERGELVMCSGAEIAFQDQQFTLVRIRTLTALNRLSLAGSWCTRNLTFRFGNELTQYEFPFDLVFENGRAAYLINELEMKDRRNRQVSKPKQHQLEAIVERAQDSFDIAKLRMKQAIEGGSRLPEHQERELIRHPKLAVDYAVRILHRSWPEFEAEVKLSQIDSRSAARYAMQVKGERWLRAEKVIVRLAYVRYQYAKHFGISLPARKRPNRTGPRPVSETQRLIEIVGSQLRVRDRERSIVDRPRMRSIYLNRVARIANGTASDESREYLRSFFLPNQEWEDWEHAQASRLIGMFRQRVFCLEPLIARDPQWSLEYAWKVIKRRWRAGERAMETCPLTAANYAVKVVKDRWFAAEPLIRPNLKAWAVYTRAFRVPF